MNDTAKVYDTYRGEKQTVVTHYRWEAVGATGVGVGL